MGHERARSLQGAHQEWTRSAPGVSQERTRSGAGAHQERARSATQVGQNFVRMGPGRSVQMLILQQTYASNARGWGANVNISLDVCKPCLQVQC